MLIYVAGYNNAVHKNVFTTLNYSLRFHYKKRGRING